MRTRLTIHSIWCGRGCFIPYHTEMLVWSGPPIYVPEPFQVGVVWPSEAGWSPWRYTDAEVDEVLRRELMAWWFQEEKRERTTYP